MSTSKYHRSEYVITAVDIAVFTIIDRKPHILLIKTNKEELKNEMSNTGTSCAVR